MTRSITEAQLLNHLPLVKSIAAKLYRARWGDAVGYEEYCQMGATGLVEAAERFDDRRGVPFGAFASWRITGAILDGLERATEQHQQLAARKRLLAERTESVAAADEGLAAVDLPEAAFARIAAVAVGLAIGFMLEGTGMYRPDKEAVLLDGASHLALRQIASSLRQAVARLPPQERTVLEQHYLQQQLFADIAASQGLTPGRIAQIHRRGLQRLREQFSAADFQGFEA